MPDITLSKKAKQDLIAIWSYIAEDNSTAADCVLDTLNEKFRMLVDHPHLGRVRSDIAPDLRFLVSDNYVVLYRNSTDGVDIVRILHGARNLSVLLEDEEGA